MCIVFRQIKNLYLFITFDALFQPQKNILFAKNVLEVLLFEKLQFIYGKINLKICCEKMLFKPTGNISIA